MPSRRPSVPLWRLRLLPVRFQAIEVMTGVDPARDFRGRYSSRNAGRHLLLAAGGIAAIAAAQGIAEIPVARAARGDVLRLRGMCLGLVALSGSDCSAIGKRWRVDAHSDQPGAPRLACWLIPMSKFVQEIIGASEIAAGRRLGNDGRWRPAARLPDFRRHRHGALRPRHHAFQGAGERFRDHHAEPHGGLALCVRQDARRRHDRLHAYVGRQ